MLQKLPLTYASLQSIRDYDYVYVDKTQYFKCDAVLGGLL